MSDSRAVAILGPTASGKTRLALELANHLPIEIISLDSALVYQDMNIGTAKPSQAEMASVPHHLIDIISPLTVYCAADFVQDTVRLVAEIHARNRLPVIVGGTMMYYQALSQGFNQLPSANTDIRAQLAQDKAEHGLASLYQRLQDADPITAARLSPNDSQRIERALEVYLISGKPMSQWLSQDNDTHALNLHTITLIPEERARLHQSIAQRFDTMLQDGFVQEVQALQQKYPDLHSDLPSMRCVGYRQVWDYLQGAVNAEQMRELGIIATRQLAKRQLTWLRKIPADQSLDPYQCQDLTQTVLPEVVHHFTNTHKLPSMG
ncbi:MULTISPECIES: tRNA (adenosine(37)-N6)-dimethylallyltransferase MiaA [Vitreoscilla]|uniref:tRNA dimethylallyltransferase n=1 Tax=Vitreoscilla stercoraria TaxID=61 RepID=A0ABY4E820_VITST|nr:MULTISPECIES: tRNA (adenosine(37)-N6)-dimethylallyltransferase MiaA [Vitreoscilla]AUZ04727.2 tRNA dimethylallyltransferase [Vitreoscilla sp. C1]UOO91589.1 tRNA (adenosine(37)-N6)-dimethylallyltransferase MiaA [Vitreoscilla stercoraria]